MSDQEFPRPCKKCGNMAMMHNGKLVHARGKREKCRMFRHWEFERDDKGQVSRMYWLGDEPIPDPPTQEQIDAQKWKEWQEIYAEKGT